MLDKHFRHQLVLRYLFSHTAHQYVCGKLEEIKSKYPTLVLMDDDIADAFNMVSDILTAEADAIKEKEPYATASLNRLEAAAYEVFSVCGDIENENFSEGG